MNEEWLKEFILVGLKFHWLWNHIFIHDIDGMMINKIALVKGAGDGGVTGLGGGMIATTSACAFSRALPSCFFVLSRYSACT